MLLLRISPAPCGSGRSLITLHDEAADPVVPLSIFWAEGEVLNDADYMQSYKYHCFILPPDFESADVEVLGRYGILKLTDKPPADPGAARCLYISGGKKADANRSLQGLLRLSRLDHREFVRLVRARDSVRCDIVKEAPASITDAVKPIKVHSEDSSAISRLIKYAASVPFAASPFLIPQIAGAQCAAPSPAYDSGSNYSGVDDNHIINSDEGGSATTGYIPDSNSGVTIAGGLDLGVHTAQDLTNMGISSDLIQQFTPFLATGPGQYTTGAAAQNALNANPAAATINSTQANSINQSIYNYYSTNVATAFNNASPNTVFSDLNVQWQTVIVSMYFQAQSITGTKFWSQVTSGDWSDALANLANFNGPSSAQNNRAAKEANYLNSTGCTNGTTNGG